MQDVIISFLIAGALGALVGSDQEMYKVKRQRGKIIFAGIRSYAFICSLGALSVYVGKSIGNVTVTIALCASFIMMLVLAGYIYSAWHKSQFGLTSELSVIIVFFLGVLIMLGERQIGVILGILLTIVLSGRDRTKHIFQVLTRDELATTLKFAVIAFIILPLLPDETYSIADIFRMQHAHEIVAMDFLNPYRIWFFVVLMSAVSYVGYILSKFIGSERGVGVSGALGGMVSSTAVTSAMSEMSKKIPSVTYPFVFATLLANLIMFVRVVFIVLVFNPSLLRVLFIPIGVMILVLVGYMYFLSVRNEHDSLAHRSKSDHLDFESPFQIGPALKFALLIVAIKFFAALALIYRDIWGPYVLYAISFFSGFADVDAVTQEMSVRAIPTSIGDFIAPQIATTAIIIAVFTNTFAKMMIAKFFGGVQFGNQVSMALLLVSLCGLASLLFLLM